MDDRIVHHRLWSLFLVVIFSIANGEMVEQDLNALLAFRNATDPSGFKLGWNTGFDPCRWRGVTCINVTAQQSRVLKLNLPGVGISGEIPSAALGSLQELTVLSLRSNLLSGLVPGDIAQCRNLRSLALQRNRFTGSVPWDFTLWPRLVRIDLSFNNFNGSLPESLASLSRIKFLLLQNNSFSGSIPAIRFPGLPESVQFSVANNNLSGQIPSTLSHLPEESFQGNSHLCGAPLTASACSWEVSPSPSAKPLNKSRSGSKLSLGAILAIVIGDLAVLGVLTSLFLLCYWHRQRKQAEKATPSAKRKSDSSDKPSDKSSSDEFTKATDYTSSDQSIQVQAGKLVFLKTSKSKFSLDDLLRASAEMIGQGCLGTSYRAVLEDGQLVTVKRIKGLDIGRKEFEQRLAVFGAVEHPNLLAPKAYYFSKSEKLIVYDFVERRSLAFHLHGDGRDCLSLDWSSRLRIALGAARGLAHLHEAFGGQLVHGDVKSSNVLVSRSLEARLADYCLIQMLHPDSALSASLPAYRAPEVVAIKKFTQQSDVYAFGVVLLELLTGRAPWKTNHRGDRVDLPRWVQSVVREEWTEEVFDQRILRFSEEEMVEMLQIALMCVATLPGDRPKMRNVVRMMEELRNWEGSAAMSPPSSEELKSFEEMV